MSDSVSLALAAAGVLAVWLIASRLRLRAKANRADRPSGDEER